MNGSSNVDPLRSPLTPTSSRKLPFNRRSIITTITLCAVAVSVIRLVAYIYYSAKLQDQPVLTLPDQAFEDLLSPAYCSAIYYLLTMAAVSATYTAYTQWQQRQLELQREQTFLRSIPFSPLSTLCYRYLETSFPIPLVTSRTTLRSALVVLAVAVLNVLCTVYPESPSQAHTSNRTGYLSIANFALLIPLSIRSLGWLPYDKAISWHRVFAVLAFVTATQHGCYHLSERLESLDPIIESSRHVTGISSLLIVGLMLLTAHEIVRANQYSWFRTLHLTLFLSFTISATLHNAAFLTLNFVGLAAWLGSRVSRKLQAPPKVISIQSTGRITHVTLEHSLKDITAGQFGYLGVRGPGFTKYGWARPFSFSGMHSQIEEVATEEKEPREAKTTISRLHLEQDTHQRPGFHHESSSAQVPDAHTVTSIEHSGGDRPAASKADHPSNLVDLHIHSRGTFTTALLKAASQQDPESKTPNQVRMELDGPYGTPWLSTAKHYYTDFELALFVCSGVGITPWLAVMQHIATKSRSSRTRDVHIIWSIHEPDTYDAFNPRIFSLLKQASVTFHIHVYITGHHSTLPSAFNDAITFHSGPPNIDQYMTQMKEKNPDIDVGVGVCAFEMMEQTVDELVHSSRFSDENARWWIKKELFRI
ncbi:hypothetical protein BC943DRAFT_327740 [Umbelopsis sp. AD052]|nr:hypothetical protein BC943DRAFT_327740 [Umbelopsis sp. AD052]